MSKSDINEILEKGFIALVIRVIGFLSGYLFIYFTIKYFGADVQGRLSLSFSFMIIGALICRAGVDVNFVKIFAINNNFDNARGIYFKILPYVLVASAGISLLVYFFSDLISVYVFNDPLLTPFLKWTSPCIFLFTFVLINAGVFRGLRKNTLYAFLFNGGRFLFTIIFFGALILLYKNDELITVKAHSFAIFTLFIISFFFIKKKLFPRSISSKYRVKGFFKDSFPMFFSASLIVLLGWSDTIVLGIYRDSETVGMYNVILKIAAVISFTLQAVDSILAPKLSRAFHDNDIKLFKSLVKFSTLVNSVISIFTLILILTFQDFILGIFGEEFIKVSLPLVILCVGQLFNSIFGPIGSIFQMTGYQRIFQNILLISFVINIILNITLGSKYGINGVAIATAFSLIFSKILGVIYIRKKVWIKQ